MSLHGRRQSSLRIDLIHPVLSETNASYFPRLRALHNKALEWTCLMELASPTWADSRTVKESAQYRRILIAPSIVAHHDSSFSLELVVPGAFVELKD